MAYGNPFGDFASNLATGFARGQEIGLRARKAAQDQEVFDHQKAEWERLDSQRNELQAAGNTLADPNNTTGLLSRDQYSAMQAPAPKPKKAKAALPAPAPDASDMAVTPGIQVAPKPKPEDYSAVMVGGQLMYAPRDRVTQLDGADLVRARAKVLGGFDPVVGAQLMAAANSLEKGNLEVSSAKWGEAVMNARRIAQVDPAKGLQTLNESYRTLMPDLGEMEFTPAKDGAVTVTQFVSTKNGRVEMGKQTVPAVDPNTGLSALDTIFTKAQSLASPEAYRQHLVDTSQFASNTADLVAKKQQTSMEKELFPLRKEALRLNNAGQSIQNETGEFNLDIAGDITQLPARQARDIIAAGEEGANGYNAVNGDRPDGGRAPGIDMPPNLTGMTIGEIVDRQGRITTGKRADGGSSAAGRYQFVRGTLINTAQAVFGKNWRDAKFSPANQDKLFDHLYEQKHGSMQSLVATWPSLAKTLAANRTALGGGKGRQAGGDVQKNIASYVADGLKNLDATPGSPERANAVAALQSEAMQIYGAMDSAPVAADMTTKSREAAPPARGLNKQGSSVTVDVPRSRPAPRSEPTHESQQVQAARGAMRLGGVAGERARARFEQQYGIPPQQAIQNPGSVRPTGRSMSVALQPSVTRGQLTIDANAAIMQGAAARAEFQRKYGQPPEAFLQGRR